MSGYWPGHDFTVTAVEKSNAAIFSPHNGNILAGLSADCDYAGRARILLADSNCFIYFIK